MALNHAEMLLLEKAAKSAEKAAAEGATTAKTVAVLDERTKKVDTFLFLPKTGAADRLNRLEVEHGECTVCSQSRSQNRRMWVLAAIGAFLTAAGVAAAYVSIYMNRPDRDPAVETAPAAPTEVR